MKKIRTINTPLVAMILGIMLLTGCSSFMYGYTHDRALDSYQLVSGEESFGARRIRYILGHNPGLKDLVDEKGLPDFLYEYVSDEKTDSVRLYYVASDLVYVLESTSRWQANSLALADERSFSSYETLTYEELLKESESEIDREPPPIEE